MHTKVEQTGHAVRFAVLACRWPQRKHLRGGRIRVLLILSAKQNLHVILFTLSTIRVGNGALRVRLLRVGTVVLRCVRAVLFHSGNKILGPRDTAVQRFLLVLQRHGL